MYSSSSVYSVSFNSVTKKVYGILPTKY